MLSIKNLLFYILVLPISGSFTMLFIPHQKKNLLKNIALNFSFFSFILSIVLWGFFNKSIGSFQFVIQSLWLPELNLNFTLGVDGISIFFLLLSTFLTPLCILASWDNVKYNLKWFLITFLVLDFLVIGAFCSLDLLFFYIFFESVLIPMYLIIGIWGSRERKILAAYYFFLYTLLGSSLMLISIVYIFWQVGSTDYELLLAFSFSEFEQTLLWLTFFIAFASKVPMIPFHLWLPEAHVEAPTAGSVLLAGILLKLGTYGFIRFLLPLFPKASFFFAPFVDTIAVASIIFASFTAIRQTDFKRIIAYTSIAHMNLVILGIFSFNVIGIEGAVLQSLSHGFVASALFLIIGVVYDRHKTRLVKYYSGLALVMPLYTTIFLFFTMANLAFPGTSSFVGELLILLGSFKINTIVTILGATSVITSGVYSLWLFNRIAYGNLKLQYVTKFVDINFREFLIFLPLVLMTLVVGIQPKFFLTTIHISVSLLVELMYF
jgi:proton-translocating NADH-quinone oxidoreductase chain M